MHETRHATDTSMRYASGLGRNLGQKARDAVVSLYRGARPSMLEWSGIRSDVRERVLDEIAAG